MPPDVLLHAAFMLLSFRCKKQTPKRTKGAIDALAGGVSENRLSPAGYRCRCEWPTAVGFSAAPRAAIGAQAYLFGCARVQQNENGDIVFAVRKQMSSGPDADECGRRIRKHGRWR